MGKRFADRGIVSVNGKEVLHVQNVSVDVQENAVRVDTMNTQRRTAGHTRGNRHVSVSFQVAVEERAAQAHLEGLDYELYDVDVSAEFGGEEYTCTRVFLTGWGTSASGVGQEVTKTYSFEAEDVINENSSGLVDAFVSGGQAASSARSALDL